MNKHTAMCIRVGIFSLFGALALSATPTPVHADSGLPSVVSLQVDNDLFGSGSDNHYTNGMQISWLPESDTVPDWFRDGVHDFPGISKDSDATFVFAIGQQMYTPDDITRENPDPSDRPYAGWLYASFGAIVDEPRTRTLHNLSIDLGFTGPMSLAGPTQRRWHDLINTHRPNGWGHQLKTEPGVLATYHVRKRIPSTIPEAGLEFDLMPSLGGAVGNIFTHGSVGAAFRIGQNLSLTFGPPFIRPSLPGAGLVRRRGEFGWNLFAGVEGRAVGRNLTLDGNTFADSRSVDRRNLVGDIQIGAEIIWKDLRLSVTQVFRTREFKGQRKPDHYGSVSITRVF